MIKKRRKIDRVANPKELRLYIEEKRKKNLPAMKKYLKELSEIEGKTKVPIEVQKNKKIKIANFKKVFEVTPTFTKKMKSKVKKNNGELFVWVHPFFSDQKSRENGKRYRKDKQQKLYQNINKILKENSSNPLLVVVEKGNVKSTKEILNGMNFRGPVTFFETTESSAQAHTTYKEEQETRREKPELNGRQVIHETVENKYKDLNSYLNYVGVEKTKVFGEFYGNEMGTKECVDGFIENLSNASKGKIEAKVIKDATYVYDLEDLRMVKRLKKRIDKNFFLNSLYKKYRH